MVCGERTAFKKHRKAARKRKILHHLPFTCFSKLRSQPCTYCGAQRKSRRGGWIDRVDSTVGYIEGNCVPCCFACNTLKSFYPPSLLPTLARHKFRHGLARRGKLFLHCLRIIQRSSQGNPPLGDWLCSSPGPSA